MTKKFLAASVLLITAVWLVGCATQTAPTPTPFTPQALDMSRYASKVDNFVVIMDASGSLNDTYGDRSKFALVKDLTSRMGKTLPEENFNGGLRTFGHGLCGPSEVTKLIYGIDRYTQSGFQAALDSVTCAGGNTPLAYAIEAAGEDLGAASGKLAVIALSDGKQMVGDPAWAVENLKGRYGDNLCFYSVVIGDDAEGTAVMEAAAEAGTCGFAVNGDAIYSADAMAGFVAKVFYDQAIDADSDGDGVPDSRDQCPGTPQGVKVDANGCPLDSDGDGVPDYMDKCPNTPQGVAVDANGCPPDGDGDGVPDYMDKCPNTPMGAHVNAVGCWEVANIEFAFDRWQILPRFYPALDAAIGILREAPALNVEIAGHTDNMGTAAYNQTLSEKRAGAVVDYMVQKGIKSSRLSSKGYGFSKPIASNDTEQGRQENRRVEIMPMK